MKFGKLSSIRDIIIYPQVTQQLDYLIRHYNVNKKTRPYLMWDPIHEVHNLNEIEQEALYSYQHLNNTLKQSS